MTRGNPKRFDRCVTKVKRSLKKYSRPGNAYAICRATKSNPTKWNPVLPLDLATVVMTPKLLSAIEGQRQKIKRKLEGKKQGRRNSSDSSVRSPTSTSSEVRSPTKTSTEAYTSGNFTATVTGGAGAGATTSVTIKPNRGQRNNLFGFLTKKKVTYHGHIVRGGSGNSKVGDYKGRVIYRTPEGDFTTSVDRDSRHDTLADAKAFIREWKSNAGGPKVDVKVIPSMRHPGRFDVIVGGFHRVTKKTRKGAEGYAKRIRQANNPSIRKNSSMGRRKLLRAMKAGHAKEIGSRYRYKAQRIGRRGAKTTELPSGGFLYSGASVGGAGEGATTSVRKNLGKRNAVPAAQERYERFHGRSSDKLVKIRTQVHEHSVLSGIGDLRKLVILSGNYRVTVKFSKPWPILSQNEAATQLFIEGGDQSVNLKHFGISNPHEEEVLGECRDVFYFTRKDHLDPRDGGTAVYHHRFKKPYPVIVYDVPNKLMRFAGGGYDIPDEGIDG